jgi:predicted aminopeptidase
MAMLVLALPGCSSVQYAWQSVAGHVSLMRDALPVADLLAQPATPPVLKERLQLTQRMRDFAVEQLHLPDNSSYRRYTDLRRSAVVWNVVAAPVDSLTLKTTCFPVAGCVGYQGYFLQADADAQAQRLRDQGWEVAVYGVPAYSTLGWMNWAGGDPLLNTFIHYPEGELARMMFHELAHQVVYVKDDTGFNESFATAVERLGAAQWLAAHASPQARRAYAVLDERRRTFRALTWETRQALDAVYSDKKSRLTLSDKQFDAIKLGVMSRFHQQYGALRASWGGFAGYDRWVGQANNASFAAQAAYDEWVPGFERLFDENDRDWPRFYDAVRALAQAAPDVRRARLGGANTPIAHTH